MSVLTSTLIYGLILLRIFIVDPKWIIEIDLTEYYYLRIVGFALVSVGFILGILAFIALRNSWRVGIRYDQKTELIESGIYRISRNPYFLSYSILIIGYCLIYPSIILMALLIVLAITFHKMILNEEEYLLSVHGIIYQDYQKRVNRYITLF